MALTLLEASKLNSGSVQQATLIETYPASSDILRVLPFETIAGNSISYNVTDTLPGIAFRGVNEAFPESTGIINPQTEVLKIAGGDLDVDKFIVDTMGQEQRDLQERMKVAALALYWTKQFIKGNSAVDPRVFDGLDSRIGGTQAITQSLTGLSLYNLDSLIDLVDNPTHLIMNKTMARRIGTAVRGSAGGSFSFELDEFGRRVSVYNGLPFLVIDKDEAGADILPGTGAGVIYCVSIGEGRLFGLQGRASGVDGISVRDLGELEAKPVLRTRVEWYTTIAITQGRAAAKLSGFDQGVAVVA